MDNAKLSVKEKIGYGMGDAGCNIIFGAIMLFVNYFYTDIFGLAPALVGVLLLQLVIPPAFTGILFGFVAGMMVFVAIDELLPAARRYRTDKHQVVYGLMAGFAVVALSLLLL